MSEHAHYYSNHIHQYAKGNYSQVAHEWPTELAIFYLSLEIIGTIGAFTILFTMISSNTFLITYRVYLILAAIIDVFMMFILGGNGALKTFYPNMNAVYYIILQSDISCRVYHVLVGFLTHFNVWIHIALMIELFVICVFPKKLTSDSSTERAHYLSLLLLSVLLIVNMNYFWTVKRQREPLGIDNVDLCYFDSSFSVFETMVYPVIECSLIGVIPFFVWLFLVIYTAKEFYAQGSMRPGGLLVPTRQYWNISYSMSTIYLMGHIPRLVWQIQRYANYTRNAQLNPGISTLLRFHTELIDGDPWCNLPQVIVMAFRCIVLLAVSSAFRKELRKAVRRVFCIWQQYTIAQGLSKTYQIGSTPLIPIVPQSKSEVSTLHTKAWQGSTESLV